MLLLPAGWGCPLSTPGASSPCATTWLLLAPSWLPTPPAGSPVVRPDDAEQSPLRTKAPELPAQVSWARRMQ